MRERAHNAWCRPHLLPQTGTLCWAEATGWGPEPLCPPRSPAQACSTVLGPWVQVRHRPTEGTVGAVGPPSPAGAGQPLPGCELVGAGLPCRRQPRHRPGLRWARAQPHPTDSQARDRLPQRARPGSPATAESCASADSGRCRLCFVTIPQSGVSVFYMVPWPCPRTVPSVWVQSLLTTEALTLPKVGGCEDHGETHSPAGIG